MPRKKKNADEPKVEEKKKLPPLKDLKDKTIDKLNKKYFDLLPKENFPKTPTITRDLDDLEIKINARLKELGYDK